MSDLDESASELHARGRLESILKQRMQRFVPDGRPCPDYTFTTTTGNLAAVEVKEIASADWLRLQDGHERYETERDTTELQMHWSVILDAEIAAERLAPVPNFPDDDEEQIARADAFGFKTVRKADRVAEFERRRDMQPSPIQIKGMIDDLIPDLATLEARGISSTRGESPVDAEGLQAWWRIETRTRRAICLGTEAKPEAGLPSGVFLQTGYGYTRTGRADTIGDRIEAWFSTKTARKLLDSLDRPEYVERHAVLVFNTLEPEWSSAQEDANTFVPTRRLALPQQVDVLWALLGARTLHYTDDSCWTEHRFKG